MADEFDRGKAIYTIRLTLGWSAAFVAKLLDVSPRMVGMFETGAQRVPNGRWRLFINEVNAQLTRENSRQLVAVLASDGVTPIDVVSDANFFDIEVNDFNGTGVISSYAIDRVTQRPYVHMQRFQLAGNEHVVRAATAWKAALTVGAGTGEREMLTMHRWLTKRVLEAEAANPELRALKEKIAAASAAVDLAVDAPEPERRELLKALDAAVFELIAEVQRTPKP